MGCIIYHHWLLADCAKAKEGYPYTYICVGLSDVARFDKKGYAKTLTRGTGDRTGSTFFVYISPITNMSVLESADTFNCNYENE